MNLNLEYVISNAAESIYLDAIKVMKENSTPKVTYSMKLNHINNSLIHTAYNLLRRVVYINDIEL